MKSFLELCEETTNKLGRRLQKREISFLQWMFERYQEEDLQTKKLEYTKK